MNALEVCHDDLDLLGAANIRQGDRTPRRPHAAGKATYATKSRFRRGGQASLFNGAHRRCQKRNYL